MDTETVTRPEPAGAHRSGSYFTGEQLAVYRLKSGIPMADVGALLVPRVSAVQILRVERADSVPEKMADRYFRAVERAVGIRQRIIDEGLQREAGTWVPPRPQQTGRWRTKVEADAILAAQHRGER
jgi:hypothetical protein